MSSKSAFWLWWAVIGGLTVFVIGPMSPFVGFGALVRTLGWSVADRIPLYLGTAVTAAILGFVMGFLALALLRKRYKPATWVLQVGTICAFGVVSLISALAFNLVSGAAFVGFIPLCMGSLLLWLIAACGVLALPFVWQRAL